MPDEDRPPERIWLDDEALTAHFDRVRERYTRMADGSHSGSAGWEDIPDSDFQQNELTAAFRR